MYRLPWLSTATADGINLSGDRRAIVSGESRISSARDGIDGAIRRDTADHGIALVGDVHVSLRVQRDACGEVEFRAGRGSPIAAISGNTRARVGADNSRSIYLSNSIVAFIGDIQIPAGVHRNRDWRPQRSNSGLASIQ